MAKRRRWGEGASIAGAALLCACGASGRSDATRLELRLRHDAGRAVVAAGDARTFVTASGETAVLTRALVTVSSVELFPCAPPTAHRLLRALSPVGVARAHGTSTDRKLAEPRVHDALGPDGVAAPLGVLRPLPGRYCFARVVLEPADADAEGAAASGMVGATLWLQGTLTGADGVARPFEHRSAGVRGVDVALPAALDLERDAAAIQVLALAYGGWLDGVDLAAAGAPEQLLARVAASVQAAP